MVTSCVAVGCTNRVKAGSGISFHRFPHSRPELLHKWVRAVRRDKWTPNKHSYICSEHFHSSCYIIKPGAAGRRLHPEAIPSIFPTLKEYYQNSYKRRKSPIKRKYLSPTKIVESVVKDHSYENPEKVELGDIVSETVVDQQLQLWLWIISRSAIVHHYDNEIVPKFTWLYLSFKLW